MIKVPSPVKTKLEELYQLCEKHPEYIPVNEVAQFLHVKSAGIRNSMENGQCPFGFSWQLGENKGFKIPTVKFFLWCTNSGVTRPWGEER